MSVMWITVSSSISSIFHLIHLQVVIHEGAVAPADTSYYFSIRWANCKGVKTTGGVGSSAVGTTVGCYCGAHSICGGVEGRLLHTIYSGRVRKF